jgi:hypothetical protein
MRKINLILGLAFAVLTMNFAKAQIIASGSCGVSLFWELEQNGTFTITGSGDMVNNYIDETSQPWASNRLLIKTIKFPAGITSIGRYTFWGCENVESIVIPNLVTKINTSAFQNCEGLKTAVVGDGVTVIDGGAFRGNNLLSKVTLGSNVQTMQMVVFQGCVGLTEIICKGATPPSIVSGSAATFDGVNQTVAIKVPCGKGFDYKASNWGTKFGTPNITEQCGSSSGIEKIILDGKVVYPNPTKDNLFIDYVGAKDVKIFDIAGKEVFSQEISDKAEINVSNLNAGIYTIVLTSETGAIGTSKIVKQ